jgi:hypothetical protein
MSGNRIQSPTRDTSVASPVDVLVAVPAHDEQDHIDACLNSVVEAVARARAEGVVADAVVGVAAHRCSDRTAALAGRLLAESSVEGAVWEDWTSETVGEVRDRAIRRLTGRWGSGQRQRWVFNTDADSIAPVDWITTCLRLAHASGSSAVAGLVELLDWEASPQARHDYRRILASGLHTTGHTHVYGANLAIRMDAYAAVGGFPAVLHGEDQAIVQRLRRAGHPVLTPLQPVVRTSGRMPGRASHGLGALLQTLVGQHVGQTAVTDLPLVPETT